MPAIDLTADLFFMAALRAGADSAGTRLLPLTRLREPLAPHDRFSQRVLLALQGLGYIEPELSLSQAEDWLYSRDWLSHGFESVSWRIVRPPSLSKIALQSWLDEPECNLSVLETWVAIWEDLALAEVAAYTRAALARSGYNPDWADGANAALAAALRVFSAQDVTYLVHIALRSLALKHQRAATAVGKLGQSFCNLIRYYVQRAEAERWTIRSSPWLPDGPRSAITTLFADVVTGLGERYYSDRPSLEAVAQALADRRTLH